MEFKSGLETLDKCILCLSPNLSVICEQNSFVQCNHCNHIFDNPRPNWNEILKFYSKETQYDEWLEEEAGRNDLWKRRLRKVLRYRKNGRLLDVGAGIGQFLFFAREYFDVVGTEISPTAIKIAKDKYDISLREGTIEDIDLNESFDVITLFHVLEHVPYPFETIERCRQLLSPEGILIVAVPNDVDCFYSARNRLFNKFGFEKYAQMGKVGLPKLSPNMSEIHLSHFNNSGLSKHLVEKKFKILSSGLDPYFSVKGLRKWRRYRRYSMYNALFKLTNKNLYETLWMTAQHHP